MAQDRVEVEPGKSIIGGKLTLAGSGAEQLTTHQAACYSVAIKADSTEGDPAGNAGTAYIWTDGGVVRCWPLVAGESISIDIASPDLIYVDGTAGDILWWMGVQR